MTNAQVRFNDVTVMYPPNIYIYILVNIFEELSLRRLLGQHVFIYIRS